MCKGSNIFSELGNFFKENAESKVINSIVNMMNRVNLVDKTVGIRKRHNCKMQYSLVLQLLLCYPFFKVKDPSHYVGSTLGKFYRCGKDMFYRMLNNGNINWRKLIYCVNQRILSDIRGSSAGVEEKVCLIADDSDLPKTGKCIENIGKIFSHTAHRNILGMKLLTLMLTDAKTQLMLDYSLCGEKGNNKPARQGKKKAEKKSKDADLVQGMTAEQRNKRMKKDHSSEAVIEMEKEYFENKINKLIKMVAVLQSTG